MAEMNRAIAVRRARALTRLAIDQMGKPEGTNAKARLQEHLAKYQMTTDDFTFTECADLRKIGVMVQNRFGDWRGAQERARQNPPPRPPRYEVKRKFTGHGEYVHDGVCPECKAPFTRRSPKQGNAPVFCSDECHTANRREKARVRMANKRSSGMA